MRYLNKRFFNFLPVEVTISDGEIIVNVGIIYSFITQLIGTYLKDSYFQLHAVSPNSSGCHYCVSSCIVLFIHIHALNQGIVIK